MRIKIENKEFIRKKILSLLKNQKEEDRLTKSRVILEKLVSMREFQEAQVVLFYASFQGEVETFEIMQQAQKLKKQIALPMISSEKKELIPSLVNDLEKDLVPGPYEIPQPCHIRTCPVDLNDIDLVVVPGLAFDADNSRLGRGAGYYDRFLQKLSSNVLTIGLAFDFQLLDAIPHQKHDIPVSRVITNAVS